MNDNIYDSNISENNIISMRNAVFIYGNNSDNEENRTALDNIDLNIKRGTFTAVLGRNGSGKSTLAKCMNGLFVPSSGDVLVNGMNTADDSVIYEIRRTAGMVFQNPDNQIVASVVEDDVAFGPENLGVPPDEIRLRIDSAMKAAGIYDHRHRSPANLSGGQKQRAAIAGVLAMEPECVIFDESTSMLDPKGRDDVMDIILDLRKKGITIILITHYMEEAVKADRIIIMDRGRIISDGTPAEIFSRANEENTAAAGLTPPAAVKMRNMIFDVKDSAAPDISEAADIDEITDISSLADAVAELASVVQSRKPVID